MCMFRTWHKVVVILILSWAVVDNCVPGFCLADSPPAGTGTHAVINRSSTPASLGTTINKNDRRQDNGAPEPVDDDCFCCSAHVMPAPHFMISDSAAPAPAVA